MRLGPARCKAVREQVALGRLKPRPEALERCVLARERKRRRREVDAVRARGWERVQQEERDAAAAGAEVENRGRRVHCEQVGQPAGPLLCLWPGDQGWWPDVEEQGAERLVACGSARVGGEGEGSRQDVRLELPEVDYSAERQGRNSPRTYWRGSPASRLLTRASSSAAVVSDVALVGELLLPAAGCGSRRRRSSSSTIQRSSWRACPALSAAGVRRRTKAAFRAECALLMNVGSMAAVDVGGRDDGGDMTRAARVLGRVRRPDPPTSPRPSSCPSPEHDTARPDAFGLDQTPLPVLRQPDPRLMSFKRPAHITTISPLRSSGELPSNASSARPRACCESPPC